MEITVTVRTTRYNAQELQIHIGLGCLVLGGENPNEYVIVTDETKAKLIRGMLAHLGIEEMD